VRMVVLLAMLAIALPFIISQAAMPYGIAVSLRFLVRPTNAVKPKYTIPEESDNAVTLTKDSLTTWTQTKGGQLARGYATRVIPLDLIYLLLLGAFLGFASTTLAGIIQWPASLSNLPISGFWLLPAFYILFDFAEDLVILVLAVSHRQNVSGSHRLPDRKARGCLRGFRSSLSALRPFRSSYRLPTVHDGALMSNSKCYHDSGPVTTIPCLSRKNGGTSNHCIETVR
jgi:hypothetical protein